MQTNKWLVGLGIAAGLAGCSDWNLWSEDGDKPRGASPSDSFTEAGGGEANPPPLRLPATPVSAGAAPPAISGGTLAVSPSGTYAVASDPDRDAVYVMRLADRSVVTARLGKGAEPGRIAFDGAEVAHVILRGSGGVARIDLAQPLAFTVTEACALPRGIAYAPATDSLAVACASGDLVTLAAADHAERSRQFIDSDLRDVVVNRAGKVLVSRYRSAELLELMAGGSVAKRRKPRERRNFLFTETVQQVTLQPAMGWRAVATGDDKVLMLHQQAQLEEVQPSPGGYGGSGSCSSISQPAVSIIGESESDFGRAFTLGSSGLVVDIALSPDQKWLAAAAPSGYLQGRETLVLYSAVNTDVIADPTFSDDAGTPNDAPSIACAFPQSTAAFESQVTAVAFAPNGQLIAQSREPAQLQIFTLRVEADQFASWVYFEPGAVVSLGGESVADSGHDLFHADVGGGITCASCHGEATDDGHVWNFGGIGPRRTQNMRGGLKGTEPFHWDGDMITFDHLVDNVLTGRMSGFPVEKQFADALISWIDAQPALRMPVLNAAAANRGKTLFESKNVGCTSCHSGEAMTNNGSFDVGTGGTFQVPALHGLGLRGPYMHDGCAKTLMERFDPACGGGDKHGQTSSLSESELQDLSIYLQGL